MAGMTLTLTRYAPVFGNFAGKKKKQRKQKNLCELFNGLSLQVEEQIVIYDAKKYMPTFYDVIEFKMKIYVCMSYRPYFRSCNQNDWCVYICDLA